MLTRPAEWHRRAKPGWGNTRHNVELKIITKTEKNMKMTPSKEKKVVAKQWRDISKPVQDLSVVDVMAELTLAMLLLSA